MAGAGWREISGRGCGRVEANLPGCHVRLMTDLLLLAFFIAWFRRNGAVVRVVKDGYRYIGAAGAGGLLCLLLAYLYAEMAGWLVWPGAVLLLLALFIAWFFRDPEREIPQGEGLIVSPADGLVVVVRPATDADGGAGTQVSVFLSVFDVHVNRAPVAGRIVRSEYRPGKFLVASLERATQENEQQEIEVDGMEGRIVFRLIAGLIARRIVVYQRQGDEVARGERVGLIKFGSRVDLLLPAGIEVLVKRGQRVRGGSTVIGRVRS